jgi:two-component sensor histidine kinase
MISMMTIRTKLLTALLCLVALFGIVCVVAWQSLLRVAESTDTIVHVWQEMEVVHSVRTRLDLAMHPLHNWFIVGDPQYQTMFASHYQDLTDQVERVKRLNFGADGAPAVRALESHVQGLGKAARRLLAAPSADRREIVRQLDGIYRDFHSPAVVATERLHHLQHERMERAHADAQRAKRQALTVTIAGGVMAILLALALGFVGAELISRPIRQLQQTAQSIGQGDLSQRVSVTTHDEIADLAQEFNRMAERLNESYSTLEQKVAERTHELSLSILEAHHRIKNNLQAVADVLTLCLLDNAETFPRKVLEDSVSRVQTIALVHEFLSQDADIRLVNVREVLDRLITLAVTAHEGQSPHLKVATDFNDVWLPSRQTTALALVANELISNALKHGLRGREGGRLEVRLQRENSHVSLRVRDNGAGLPPDFDVVAHAHVGLRVTRRLVERDLSGQLRLHRNGGTCAEVSFDVE